MVHVLLGDVVAQLLYTFSWLMLLLSYGTLSVVRCCDSVIVHIQLVDVVAQLWYSFSCVMLWLSHGARSVG